MRWPYRLLMFAFGLYVILYGVIRMDRGYFAYENGRGQTVFAPAVIAFGVVIALLAFLPSGNRFYKRISTKRKPIDTTYHSHRERSAAHHALKDDPSQQNHSE